VLFGEIKLLFSVTKSADGDRMRILFMGLSATRYQTLRYLMSPEIPKDVAFADLCKLLISHYDKAT